MLCLPWTRLFYFDDLKSKVGKDTAGPTSWGWTRHHYSNVQTKDGQYNL